MRLYLQDASHRLVREVIAFGLYLPGLEMMLSAERYNASVGERQMLFEHLPQLDANDLLVLDRGYPARWLIAHLTQQNIAFCMRVDQTGFVAVQEFLRSGKAEQRVTIRKPNAMNCKDYESQPIASKVRLVRIITPNGHKYLHKYLRSSFRHGLPEPRSHGWQYWEFQTVFLSKKQLKQ